MEKILINQTIDKKDLSQIVSKVINFTNFNDEFYLLLSGDLGAGKTTFTKELLKQLKVKDNVTSPTFVIMNQYQAPNNININHVDAYRLTKNEDTSLYEEQFSNALNVIEWYEQINIDFQNKNKLVIRIEYIDLDTRRFIVEG